MATYHQKDIQLLLIGAAATKTTGGISSMNDGEIGIFTPSGTRLTEATAATAKEFIIVKKTANGGVPLISSTIKKADIKNCKAKAYVPATNQVQTVGYDGTSGSIDLFNDNAYNIRFNIVQGRTSNHGGLYIKHAFYKSDFSATQFEVAHNLLKAATIEFSKEPDKIINCGMLSSDPSTALGGSATLSIVEGSKYATASSGAHGLVAGDAVRMGSATTDAVYVVESVSGTTIKFTTVIKDPTNSALAAEKLNSVTGNFGLVFAGIPQPFKTGKLEQDGQPLIFDVQLQNFGATQNVTVAAATSGNGTEKQIKSLEFFAQGNEGDFLRMGEPLIFDRRVEASGNYDLIDIEIEELYKDSIVAGPVRKRYTLAIPSNTPNYAVTGTADDITDVLEVLAFGSANGALNL